MNRRKTARGLARIEQVWFAGAHSNVGGGYPRQGMSLTALDWMMTRAEAYGLRFHAEVRAGYQGAADVNDKRYDSRAGLGIFYRWRPRDVQQLCERCGVEPQVHRSVFERIARNTEGYAPGSLPTSCQVVSTAARPDVRDRIAAIIADAFQPGPPLLRRTRSRQQIGQARILVADPHHAGHRGADVREVCKRQQRRRRRLAGGRHRLADNGLSSHWLGILASTVWHYPWTRRAGRRRRLDCWYGPAAGWTRTTRRSGTGFATSCAWRCNLH